MSSYRRNTKHPLTGKVENAYWIDDLLGHHHYGVAFPSDLGIEDIEEHRAAWDALEIKEARKVAIDPEVIKLETL